ncbi:Dehydrogenase, partial [Teratosphaeria destructans]
SVRLYRSCASWRTTLTRTTSPGVPNGTTYTCPSRRAKPSPVDDISSIVTSTSDHGAGRAVSVTSTPSSNRLTSATNTSSFDPSATPLLSLVFGFLFFRKCLLPSLKARFCAMTGRRGGAVCGEIRGVTSRRTENMGGTQGIGRTLTQHFHAQNAHVHFCARTAPDITTTTTHLTTLHPSAPTPHGTALDVSDPTALTTWVHAVAAQHASRIDVVVANVSALAATDDHETWQKAFRTDLLSVQVLYHAALPYLETTRGNVVSIASVSGRIVDFTAPGPYGSLKAALVHYTSSLAHAWAPKGIRCNTVSPGNIYIADGAWGKIEREMPDLFKQSLAANPMGRMGRPEEIADAVLFLASERASFVSGANLVVDGALGQGVQF